MQLVGSHNMLVELEMTPPLTISFPCEIKYIGKPLFMSKNEAFIAPTTRLPSFESRFASTVVACVFASGEGRPTVISCMDHSKLTDR